ncbi:MAG TPA: response regulator transcription factor [Anaerolineae bacterium]|mgnify:CR=1 FL=1|nr:response regulator transcription factor [Anaerolineae bacterium]
MIKILLIDHNETTVEALRNSLEKEGYYFYDADSGQAGLKVAWQQSPDLVILDLTTPMTDGFETCRRLRELGVPSILVKSPKHDEKSVVKALEMGADDYLHKPVAVPILLAKIRTLLRRHNQNGSENRSVYYDGQLSIDLESRQVKLRGQVIKLTPTEFRLLSILMRRVGRVVTHEELIQEIWGTEKDVGLGSLKLYVHYLRQKIEDKPKKPYYLLAEWGIGYRLREPKSEAMLRSAN